MPDDDLIPSLLAPPVVNVQALDEARRRNAGALSAAREERTKARAAFGTDIESTLRAIDETTKTLRDAHTSKDRWNLPLLAMSAGMLRTQPGVQSNFFNELGNGMAAMGPVIQQQRMSDEQFWKGIADLQTKRGEISSMPSKIDIASGDKEIDRAMQGQNTLEAAAIRGMPSNQIAQQRLTQQEAQAQAKLLEQMTQHSQSSITDLLRGKEDVAPEDQELLRRYDLQRRIEQHNAQQGAKPLINPAPLTPEDVERAKTLMKSIDEKGLGALRAKTLNEIREKAEKAARSSYSDVWTTLTQDQRDALIENEMAPRIQQYNDQNKGDEKKQVKGWEPSKDVNAARSAAESLLNPARVDKADVAAAGLPVADIPNTFDGMAYAKRMELLKTKEHEAAKQIEEARAAAEKAPAAQTASEVEAVLQSYDRTARKGAGRGMLPAIGSKDAQLVDDFVNKFRGKDNPLAGTGPITDFERGLINKMTPSREMEPEMFRYMAARYAANAVRNQAKSEFLQTWAKTHKTLDGADVAWNRYLRSEEGSIVDTRASKERKFPVLKQPMDWRTFFQRENAKASGGKPGLTWNPTTGELE